MTLAAILTNMEESSLCIALEHKDSKIQFLICMSINTEPKSLCPTAGPDSFTHCANMELKIVCLGQRTEAGQKQRGKELEIKHGNLLPIILKLSSRGAILVLFFFSSVFGFGCLGGMFGWLVFFLTKHVLGKTPPFLQ